MLPTCPLFKTEQHCRRASWTPGLPIVLADGLTWRLPVLDEDLLAAHPELSADIRETQALFESATPGVGSDEEDVTVLTRCQGRLTEIAVRLLRVNYATTDAAWAALVDFDDLMGSCQLTLNMSFALDGVMMGLAA